MTPDELKAKVNRIVIVIMENRSFDNVLGYLRHPQQGNRNDVEGIEDLNNPAYANANSDSEAIFPFWMDDNALLSDLPHERDEVKEQLAHSTLSNEYEMNGFVKAYEDTFHSAVAKPPVMGLLQAKDLPTTATLADRYTVCDNWFACLPTSTAPNRMMSMCGYTEIDTTNALVPDQKTVYDWLLAHEVSWRVYSAGLPFLTLMPRLSPLLLTSHFRRFGDLEQTLKTDFPIDKPHVIFVEPDYYDSPIHFDGACDNHPPLPMAPGEVFLGKICRILSNDAGWAKTLLVITYDEHGGFFDHVPPKPIKYRNSKAGISFDSTGPRVPAIVAGRFARKGVAHELLDNTSILQMLADRFGEPGESYSPEVAGRLHQGIQTLTKVLTDTGESSAIQLPAMPALKPLPTTRTARSPLTQAFDNAAKRLVAQHGIEALAKFPELGSRA